MVPMDQPEVSLNMINTFLQNKRFGKGQSKLGVALSGPLDDGSPSLQCPRSVDPAANNTTGQGGGGAGDTLIDKLSFWSGAKKKSGSGNLRKQRPRPPQKPARRTTTDSEFSSSLTDLLADREPGSALATPSPVSQFDACPFATAEHPGCCVSMEFLVQARSPDSWMSPDRLTGPAFELANKALQTDLDYAVQRITTDNDLKGVSVHANFGRTKPAAKDVIWRTNADDTQAQTKSADLFLSVEICGSASDVRTVASDLAMQVQDSASPLQGGLLTSHLHPQHTVIMVHQPTQPRATGSSM